MQLIVQFPNQNATSSDDGGVLYDFDYHLYAYVKKNVQGLSPTKPARELL
jgi:hypothetical protein